MGIEPTSEAWEASILPLYDARSPNNVAKAGTRRKRVVLFASTRDACKLPASLRRHGPKPCYAQCGSVGARQERESGLWRKQEVRWSLTRPVACMKA